MNLRVSIYMQPEGERDNLTAEESARLLGGINAGLSEAFAKLGLTIKYDVALSTERTPPAEVFTYTGSFHR
jgi:hypothetical protein